jgi:hypothetical protein
LFEDVKKLRRENSSHIGATFGKLARGWTHYLSKITQCWEFLMVLRYDAGSTFLNVSRQQHWRDLSPNTGAKFVVVVFTCASHFEFLRVALNSLKSWSGKLKEVHIYVDKYDDFSSAQRSLLQSAVVVPINVTRTKYKMSWAGLRVILNELWAFHGIYPRLSHDEFLVKMDSDIICLNDDILKFTERNAALRVNDAIAVGASVRRIHPCVQDEYMQGGCYIISAHALAALLQSRIAGVVYYLIKKRGFGLPEDQFISIALERAEVHVVERDFIHFSSKLTQPKIDDNELLVRIANIPMTASVLHFEGDKRNMRRVAQILRSGNADGHSETRAFVCS